MAEGPASVAPPHPQVLCEHPCGLHASGLGPLGRTGRTAGVPPDPGSGEMFQGLNWG